MQRGEFWERQFNGYFTVNHLTGFYCSILTVFFYSVECLKWTIEKVHSFVTQSSSKPS